MRSYYSALSSRLFWTFARLSPRSALLVNNLESLWEELVDGVFYTERGEERAVKFLVSLFFSLFFSHLPNFFGRFSLLPDFSPFSLISLLRGFFYLLLHHSASFLHVLKEGKHTKRVGHVVIFRCSHTTLRFCHVSLKLWCFQHLF